MSRLSAPSDGGEVVARRYQPGWAGVLYLATTLFLAIGAINSQNNLLFVAFGLAMGGMLVSGIVSGAGLMGVRGTRLGAHGFRVGEAGVIRYRIWNTNRLVPAYGLLIEELERIGRDEHGERMHALGASPAFCAQVRARRSIVCEAGVVPARRGVVLLVGMRVSSSFPFGLVRKSVWFRQHQRIVVRPARIGLSEGVLACVRSAADVGTQVSTRVGMGDDFFGVREYVPGDAPRTIAWRASARVGDLLVRQTSAPVPSRLWVILDLHSEGRTPASTELAIAGACAVVRAAVEAQLAVGLCVPGHGVLEPPRQGARHADHCERRLAELETDRRTPAGCGVQIPARSLLRESFIVVHAGRVDPSLGPGMALRVSALEPASLVRDPTALPPSLREEGVS